MRFIIICSCNLYLQNLILIGCQRYQKQQCFTDLDSDWFSGILHARLMYRIWF